MAKNKDAWPLYLAAIQVRLGRLGEARAIVARLLKGKPGFTLAEEAPVHARAGSPEAGLPRRSPQDRVAGRTAYDSLVPFSAEMGQSCPLFHSKGNFKETLNPRRDQAEIV